MYSFKLKFIYQKSKANIKLSIETKESEDLSVTLRRSLIVVGREVSKLSNVTLEFSALIFTQHSKCK